MKAICILSALFVFSIAACSESSNTTPTAAGEDAPPSDMQTPSEEEKSCSSETTPPTEEESDSPRQAREAPDKFEDKWLVVEAHSSGWLLEGKVINDRSMQRAMGEWSKYTNPEYEITGRDEDGISQNTVVFRSKADVSANKLFEFLERMVESRMYKCCAQLILDGGSIVRSNIELPLDEGLFSDNDSRPIEIRTGLLVSNSDSQVRYAFSFDQKGWNTIKNGVNKQSRKFGSVEYNKLVDSLVDAIRKHDGETKRKVTEIEVGIASEKNGDHPSWGFLFAVLDAANQAKPTWAIFFHYNDALQQYGVKKTPWKGPAKEHRKGIYIPPEPEMEMEEEVEFED